MRHHVDESLLLLLPLLCLGGCLFLCDLGLLDGGDVDDGTDETGFGFVTKGPEEEHSPLAVFSLGVGCAAELDAELVSVTEGLSIGCHDAVVVFWMNALRPRAKFVLALVRGELEKAIVYEHGLGVPVENGQSVG